MFNLHQHWRPDVGFRTKRLKGRCPKLHNHWFGPYVLELVGEVVYHERLGHNIEHGTRGMPVRQLVYGLSLFCFRHPSKPWVFCKVKSSDHYKIPKKFLYNTLSHVDITDKVVVLKTKSGNFPETQHQRREIRLPLCLVTKGTIRIQNGNKHETITSKKTVNSTICLRL